MLREQNDPAVDLTSAKSRRGKWTLLPDEDHLSWTPYAWLVYLGIFLAEPVSRIYRSTLPAAESIAVALGLALFLWTYFRGYWLKGVQLLHVVAVHTGLGVFLAPFTTGSVVFFAYAASFAGNLDTTVAARRAIVTVVAVAALTLWCVGAPIRFAIPAAAMALMIGFVNMHYAENRRTNARLRLAQGQIAQLAAVGERERIARDLHDVLGHTLSLIVLKAELAGKLLAREPSRAANEIRDVEQVSREALRDVREAISGYRTSFAEEVQRSRSLLQAAAIQADMTVNLPQLPQIMDEALALALREGVTNVVRHARATRCRVQTAAGGAYWSLTIEDDGIGRKAPEGSGLRGMRERIEALGGVVTQQADNGMSLTIRLPREPSSFVRSPSGGVT